MKPAQVLDSQADLLSRAHDRFFRAVCIGHLGEGHHDAARGQANAAAMVDRLPEMVQSAEAFHVIPDMTSLTVWLASQLDGTDQFLSGLAPSLAGLVRLEEPWPIKDVRGKTMLAHWVLWAPTAVHTRPGGPLVTATAVWLFNDQRTQPDEIAVDLVGKFGIDSVPMRAMGGWGLISADVLTDGMRIGPAMVAMGDRQAAEVLSSGDMPSEATNATRLLHALWMLLGQTIAVQNPADLDRGTARRAGRAGLPGRVTIVTLRQGKHTRSEGESLVDWQHRWVVRMHPRWQPYGKRVDDTHDHVFSMTEASGGRLVRWCTVPDCSHRLERILIAPYIKGPDNAPLRVPAKVYALRR